MKTITINGKEYKYEAIFVTKKAGGANIGVVVQQHGGHRDVFDHIAVQHPPAGALCLLLQHWQHFLFWGFTAAAVIFPA